VAPFSSARIFGGTASRSTLDNITFPAHRTAPPSTGALLGDAALGGAAAGATDPATTEPVAEGRAGWSGRSARNPVR